MQTPDALHESIHSDSRDALNAVLGLLKVLEQMTVLKDLLRMTLPESGPENPRPLIDYTSYTLHGLLEKFLDLAILWQPLAAKGVYLKKRSHESLPSWSWAGWEVSKFHDIQHSAANTHQPRSEVRFKQPFWVGTSDDLLLKKDVAGLTDDDKPTEERLKPLMMWYRCI